jgi:hypothetical protein
VTATLLDNPRRATAGAFETLLVIGVGVGFAVLPVLFLRHPQQVAPLEWLVAAPGLVVAFLALLLALWRIMGQETLTLRDGPSLDLVKTFGVPSPRPPTLQPWGLRIAYVVDPSGVLWHFAQRREHTIQDS